MIQLVQATRGYGCSLCPRPIKFGEVHYTEDGVRTHKRCRRLVLALMHGTAKPEKEKTNA